jgi:hypothetical protein
MSFGDRLNSGTGSAAPQPGSWPGVPAKVDRKVEGDNGYADVETTVRNPGIPLRLARDQPRWLHLELWAARG